MNLITSNQTNTITMTSLELVEYINSDRKQQAIEAGAEFPSKEFAKLEHKSFLAKVPLVLEIEPAKKFAGQYKAGNGQLQPMYTFPKREACLMAMSYSYELQAKVFDYMTELEARVSLPTHNYPVLCIEDQAANSLSAFLRVGVMLKVPEHIVQVEGVKDAKLRYGIDFSPLLLSAPAQNDIKFEEEMLEPTELGKRLGYGAAKMNLILCSFGLQSKVDGEWVPTEKGAGLSFHHQWHKGSKSGYNYKWRVAAIEDMLREEEAA